MFSQAQKQQAHHLHHVFCIYAMVVSLAFCWTPKNGRARVCDSYLLLSLLNFYCVTLSKSMRVVFYLLCFVILCLVVDSWRPALSEVKWRGVYLGKIVGDGSVTLEEGKEGKM